MSQSVGNTYKSKIPSFGDDSSVVEAFRLYHYGIDNFTSGTPAADSIEGNFTTLSASVTAVDGRITNNTVKLTSLTASPNTVVPQSNATIPLIIRGASSQSANLLDIQNSASATLAKLTSNGSFATSGYASIGDIAVGSTTSLKITIASATHKGITIKSASSQSENLQEWQDSTGTAMSWVTYDGTIYQRGTELGSNIVASFFLMGA